MDAGSITQQGLLIRDFPSQRMTKLQIDGSEWLLGRRIYRQQIQRYQPLDRDVDDICVKPKQSLKNGGGGALSDDCDRAQDVLLRMFETINPRSEEATHGG